MTGKIFIENYEGKNNTPERYEQWSKLGLYRNLSTIWVTPTRGTCSTRVAFSWMNVMGASNTALAKMCIEGFEVGEAYNQALVSILSNPALAKFQYMLTVEEDNTPPMDGLLKLYESIAEYDVVGGLYWTKGFDGVPMIWGDPKDKDSYVAQPPIENTLQQCNGLGMGFSLFRLDMFKNPGFEFGKWFKTIDEKGKSMTQDLYFFRRAAELGYKFACDTRVKVGHFDINTGEIF
tara:strand:+ start:265 stop:966 length:702 start_codon:yes stop_codon:yes gene_type:complete